MTMYRTDMHTVTVTMTDYIYCWFTRDISSARAKLINTRNPLIHTIRHVQSLRRVAIRSDCHQITGEGDSCLSIVTMK